MRVGVGVEVGSALVPPSGSVSELSPSAPCWQTRTPTTPITTRTATMATTHPRRLTIHRRGIIRPREAVGAPITDTITLVEERSAWSLAPEQRYTRWSVPARAVQRGLLVGGRPPHACATCGISAPRRS